MEQVHGGPLGGVASASSEIRRPQSWGRASECRLPSNSGFISNLRHANTAPHRHDPMERIPGNHCDPSEGVWTEIRALRVGEGGINGERDDPAGSRSESGWCPEHDRTLSRPPRMGLVDDLFTQWEESAGHDRDDERLRNCSGHHGEADPAAHGCVRALCR
jgi:hypothetical protein